MRTQPPQGKPGAQTSLIDLASGHGLPLVVLDVAVEASDGLPTVEVIVSLEGAVYLVKLGLSTRLVPPSVRLARRPGEVGY